MSVTSIVPHTATWQDRVITASEAVLDTGVEPEDATLLAALAEAGWTADLAAAWLPDLVPQSERDRELIEAESRSIRDPWHLLYEDCTTDQSDALRALRRVLIETAPQANGVPARGSWRRPAGQRPAAWLVRDFIARERRHVWAGRHGSAKTTIWAAIMAASLKREPFLGREVPLLRWLVISGEQTAQELTDTFDAFGIDPAAVEQYVHWSPREAGVRLGDPAYDRWLAEEVQSFCPDVIVLDTVGMVCANVAVRDNDAVRALYRDVLTPLVDGHGVALLAITHERKGSGRGDEGVIGAVDWTNQADLVATLTPTGPLDVVPDGDRLTTSRPFAFRRTKTSRIVSDPTPEHYVVSGRVNSEGVTDSLSVTSPEREVSTSEQLLAALDSSRLGRSALAKAVGLNATGTKFRDALTEAVDSGLVTKADDGLYKRAEA